MTGRLNGIRYFLTYSQLNDELIDADAVADALFLLNPSWLEVCREFHQDDGIHYHAVIVFRTRRQQQVATYFNILPSGDRPGGYHPNVKPIKNANKDLYYRRHYIRKEDKAAHDTSHKDGECDYTGIPTVRGDAPPYSDIDTAERDDWGAIIEESADRSEFLERVRKSYPKDFVLKHDAILGYAASYYAQPQDYIPDYPRESYTVPPAMDAWIDEVLGEVIFVPARSREPPFVN